MSLGFHQVVHIFLAISWCDVVIVNCYGGLCVIAGFFFVLYEAVEFVNVVGDLPYVLFRFYWW